MKDKKCIVVGGAGFIGSHLVDRLVKEGAQVRVLDNFSCCDMNNMNDKAQYINQDICDYITLERNMAGYEYVFNTAAIARTPWCIDDPILCYRVNVLGTLHVLESARKNNFKRVILSSSNVVYAFDTPYRTSKEAVERLSDTYNKMYKVSSIALRYSNVYGPRQLESGPSPNVFAALRKSKKDYGKLLITGNGEQSRDYTHVYDIVSGNIKAALSDYSGTIDLCTGINTSLNKVAEYFNCPIEYIAPRAGDIEHIYQDYLPAKNILGWEATIRLEEGIKDVL